MFRGLSTTKQRADNFCAKLAKTLEGWKRFRYILSAGRALPSQASVSLPSETKASHSSTGEIHEKNTNK
jgi:hypothetical protein